MLAANEGCQLVHGCLPVDTVLHCIHIQLRCVQDCVFRHHLQSAVNGACMRHAYAIALLTQEARRSAVQFH